MKAENSEGEFLSKLTVEVEAWQRRGLISGQQGHAILAYYNLRSTAGRAFRLGPAATLVSIVGSIVLGVGVLIFFGAYWHVLPAWSKVVLVIASTGTAYAAGYWLQFRWRVMPRVGASLLLLGSILFQAGLFLLAQTFGKPVDSPILLLVGTAGVLPLAYFTGSRPLLVFGLLDGLAWLGWTLADHYPKPPESFGLPLIYILAGVLIYALGRFHTLLDRRRHFEPIYQVLGLTTILVPMYVLTFGSFWDAAREQHLASVHVPLLFGAAVLLAVAGAASLLLARLGDMSARAEAGIFAVIALVAGFVAYVPAWAGGYALLFNTTPLVNGIDLGHGHADCAQSLPRCRARSGRVS